MTSLLIIAQLGFTSLHVGKSQVEVNNLFLKILVVLVQCSISVKNSKSLDCISSDYTKASPPYLLTC